MLIFFSKIKGELSTGKARERIRFPHPGFNASSISSWVRPLCFLAVTLMPQHVESFFLHFCLESKSWRRAPHHAGTGIPWIGFYNFFIVSCTQGPYLQLQGTSYTVGYAHNGAWSWAVCNLHSQKWWLAVLKGWNLFLYLRPKPWSNRGHPRMSSVSVGAEGTKLS